MTGDLCVARIESIDAACCDGLSSANSSGRGSMVADAKGLIGVGATAY